MASQSLQAPPAALAGRDAELRRLTELYERARDHGPRLVALHGPSGVGKSRLLQELRTRVRLEGGAAFEGRSERGRAFGPFAEIVGQALRFLSEIGGEPSVDVGDLACGAGCHRFWYLHEGAAFGADHVAAADALSDRRIVERRQRFFGAVAGIFADVARSRAPLVIIHDVDRADEGTVELLQYLLDESPELGDPIARDVRGLFAVTLPDDRDPRVAPILTHRSSERIALGRLDEEGVRALLSSPETVARVLARTGGVPEAIDLLLDAEPPSAASRLARRLDSLSAPVRALHEALAVLARPADLDELIAMTARTVDAATRAEFARSPLVDRTVVDGRMLFSFARETDRDRVYESLVGERRRALHRSAVDVRERLGVGDTSEAAHHALAAGDRERATQLGLAAASTLAARHAHAEASKLLEAIVEACEGRVDIVVREQLSDLYSLAGDYRRALDHARFVVDAEPDAPEHHRRLGHLLTLAGDVDAAASALERAHELATAASDSAVLAEVEGLLAELSYQRSAHSEARQWADRALAHAASAESLALALPARNTLGKIALGQSDLAQAEETFAENARLAREGTLPHFEAQALTNVGITLLRRQRLVDAEGAFAAAIEVARRAGDTRECAIATENLAVLAHTRRDYGRALERYHEAVAYLKRLGNRAMLAGVAINLGELYLSLGDVRRAEGLATFAAQVGSGRLAPGLAAEALVLRGRIAIALGDSVVARAVLADARKSFAEAGYSDAPALLELARLELTDGHVDAAEPLLRAITSDRVGTRAELAILLAEVTRARGDDPETAARAALLAAEEANDPERCLRAKVLLARCVLERGEASEAERIVRQARTEDEALGVRAGSPAAAFWRDRPIARELLALEQRLSSQRAESGTRASVPPPSMAASRRGGLVGDSHEMQTVRSVIERVAPTDALVLIRGESGTGKELVADALHYGSRRRDRPFVKVNCAALVETLLLSELFGHERGAFTGASARKKGRFELADGGTIFLDEIGDISPKTQVALLRVLQERTFERVGGTQPIRVDVRIVAATHRDLEEMVRRGEFREDLYYRLRGVVIDMPALRDRIGDLPNLVADLLGRIAAERAERPKNIASDAISLLARHRWPGNVRELDNVLRSATLFADGEQLNLSDFQPFTSTFQPVTDGAALGTDREKGDSEDEIALAYRRIRSGALSLFDMKKQIERECIVRALSETDGNITRAAGLLGMKRPRLSQLVKEYGLSGGDGADGSDGGES